jgi:hypothetical protein
VALRKGGRKRVNPFEKQLRHALEWEKKLRPKLEAALRTSKTLRLFFSKVASLQSVSSDAEIEFSPPKIDFKIREPKYHHPEPDILIELRTAGKLGWFYTTESVIYYGWERYPQKNPGLNCLIEGFFIDIPRLRETYPRWIETMIDRYYRERTYAVSEAERDRWITRNVFVPHREFPKDLILRFNLDPEPERKQRRIENWIRGGINVSEGPKILEKVYEDKRISVYILRKTAFIPLILSLIKKMEDGA